MAVYRRSIRFFTTGLILVGVGVACGILVDFIWVGENFRQPPRRAIDGRRARPPSFDSHRQGRREAGPGRCRRQACRERTSPRSSPASRRRTRNRRANSTTPVPSPSSSPSSSRRRRPTPASTRRRRRSSASPTRRRRWSPSASSGSPSSSAPSASTAPRRRTSSRCREMLLADHGGEVPRSREALERSPASAGRPPTSSSTSPSASRRSPSTPTSSASSNRTGIAPGRDPLAVEIALEKAVPERFRLHAHHWLILHGRYVCKARKPECALPHRRPLPLPRRRRFDGDGRPPLDFRSGAQSPGDCSRPHRAPRCQAFPRFLPCARAACCEPCCRRAVLGIGCAVHLAAQHVHPMAMPIVHSASIANGRTDHPPPPAKSAPPCCALGCLVFGLNAAQPAIFTAAVPDNPRAANDALPSSDIEPAVPPPRV